MPMRQKLRGGCVLRGRRAPSSEGTACLHSWRRVGDGRHLCATSGPSTLPRHWTTPGPAMHNPAALCRSHHHLFGNALRSPRCHRPDHDTRACSRLLASHTESTRHGVTAFGLDAHGVTTAPSWQLSPHLAAPPCTDTWQTNRLSVAALHRGGRSTLGSRSAYPGFPFFLRSL